MKLRQHYALILGTVSVIIVILVSTVFLIRQGHIERKLQQSSFTAMSESLFHENENAARALTTALTKSLVEPVALDNFDDIANVAKSSRKLPRVSKLLVFDAKGLLLHDGTDEIHGFSKPVSAALVNDIHSDIEIKLEREKDLLKVCAPIRVDKRVLGGIYMEVKLDEVNSHIQQLKAELEDIVKNNNTNNIIVTLFLALLLSLLAIAGGVFVSRYLSRPILTLSEQARNIGQGQYQSNSNITQRPDELGELAKSLQWMANELSNHTYTKAQLEKLVQVRTKELEVANEKLLKVDETRREFLTDLSHELRTPLTAIRGISEVRLRTDEKLIDKDRSALTRIVELCGELSSLVDDLLFIARSESGSPELNTTTLSLCNLLSNVKQQMDEIAKQHRVTLTIACQLDSLVEGDPRRLRQLFSILIDNAIKYSHPDSEVRIEITARSDITQNLADVRIRDSGIGMTQSEQDQSTMRFFRGERAREKHDNGMGLGLSIARAIAAAHEIDFDLSSVVNKGTTALITFNLEENSLKDKLVQNTIKKDAANQM